jgi:hypothetical protein
MLGAMAPTVLAALLADALLVLHALFIVWVMAGALAVWRWPRLVWAHLPAAAGGDAPGGDFLQHYLGGLIYPEGLTREVQIVLGALVLGVNAAIYLAIWRRRASRSRIA